MVKAAKDGYNYLYLDVTTFVPKAITGVSVKTQPTKLGYQKNDTLDSSDGIITVTYNTNETIDVSMDSADCTITGFDSKTKAGTETLAVTYQNYQDKTANFDVFVYSNEECAKALMEAINTLIAKNNSNFTGNSKWVGVDRPTTTTIKQIDSTAPASGARFNAIMTTLSDAEKQAFVGHTWMICNAKPEAKDGLEAWYQIFVYDEPLTSESEGKKVSVNSYGVYNNKTDNTVNVISNGIVSKKIAKPPKNGSTIYNYLTIRYLNQ